MFFDDEPIIVLGHRHLGLKKGGFDKRHFSSPKMPKTPPQAEEAPQRSDADKAAAQQRAAQRQMRGRRSTLIAGAAPAESGNLGGSRTLLGGGGGTGSL
jgi:hypothetical protein